MPAPRIAIGPPSARPWLADAVAQGGGELVDADAADALVWAAPNAPDELAAILDGNVRLQWVQLPWAGVEPYVTVIRAHADRVWTCGKGVYAEPVAEHALALLLAGLRGLSTYVCAESWSRPRGVNLLGTSVAILGGGGITTALLRMLGPFGCDISVVRRHPEPMDGAARVVGMDALDETISGAGALVLALALTPETEGIVDRRRLGLLADNAWLVNVARGRHVVTDDLVVVLTEGGMGGAALDVTEPEPLPDGHPLWALPNCIVTPHVGNTPDMAVPLLGARIAENVRRFAAGEPLIGGIDADLGY